MVKEGIAEEVALEPRPGNRRTYLKNGVEGKGRACVYTKTTGRLVWPESMELGRWAALRRSKEEFQPCCDRTASYTYDGNEGP